MMDFSKRALLLSVPAAAVALALGGCAHPQLAKVGTPEAEILVEYGNPDSRTAMSDGTERLVYSLQPFGQECWWLFLRDGRLERSEQALREDNMVLVRHGMRIEEVRSLFGMPARVYEFRSINEEAYLYRFLSDVRTNVALWVQYNKDGVVTDTAITIDPWTDTKFLFP